MEDEEYQFTRNLRDHDDEIVGGDDDEEYEEIQDKVYKLETTPIFIWSSLRNDDIKYVKKEQSDDEIDSSHYGKHFEVGKVDFIDERKRK